MRAWRDGAFGAVCLVAFAGACAQQVPGAPPGQALQVHAGQVIPLRLLDTLSSDASAPGEVLHFEAVEDVVLSGRVIVRRGATATAEVVRASKHWKIGQGGRVSLKLNEVALADGSRLPLDAAYAKGGGGLGKKTFIAVAVASAALLSPAGAGVLLLSHGEEVTIPSGTAIQAYVATDKTLEAAKFAEPGATDAAPAPPTDSKKPDTLLLETSAGDGSVWIGDAYQGEAPMTLKLKRGVYPVRIFRDGYHAWGERVVVDGDTLKLKVTLLTK